MGLFLVTVKFRFTSIDRLAEQTTIEMSLQYLTEISTTINMVHEKEKPM